MKFTEIERKFLINPTKIPYDLNTIGFYDIIQGYASSTNSDLNYRLRQSVDHNGDIIYHQTIKGKGTKIKTEVEIKLSKEQFDVMWIVCENTTLQKRRYNVDNYDLDQYKNDLAPLWTIEVEFDTIEECDSFIVPNWFGEEVTEDVRWSNHNIAINGLPEKIII
jgi:CYTH domain-containing protein